MTSSKKIETMEKDEYNDGLQVGREEYKAKHEEEYEEKDYDDDDYDYNYESEDDDGDDGDTDDDDEDSDDNPYRNEGEEGNKRYLKISTFDLSI